MRSSKDALQSYKDDNAYLCNELSGSVQRYQLLEAQYNILFQEHQALLEDMGLDKNGNPLPKRTLTKERVAELKEKYTKQRDQQPRITELEQALAAVKEELRVITLKFNDASITKPSAATLAAYTSEANRAKSDVVRLEKKVKELTSQLEAVTADLIKSKETSTRLSQLVESLSFDLRDARSFIGKHEKKEKELSSQLEVVTAELIKSKDTAVDLNYALAVIEGYEKKDRELTTLLQVLTDELRNTKETSTLEVAQLTDAIQMLQAQLAEAHTKIEKLKRTPKKDKVPAEVARLNEIIKSGQTESVRLRTAKGKGRAFDPVDDAKAKKTSKHSTLLSRGWDVFLYSRSSGVNAAKSTPLARKCSPNMWTVFRTPASTGPGSDPHKLDRVKSKFQKG